MESELDFYHYVCLLNLVFIVGSFLFLTFVLPAPYGRHIAKGWGCLVPARLWWVIFESPNLIHIPIALLICPPLQFPNACLLAMYGIHYINRTLIYPFRVKSNPVPISIPLSALSYTLMNSYLQTAALTRLESDHVIDPLFVVGAALWLAGFLLNLQSDNILLNLRKPGETAYKIPKGGLF